LIATHLLSAILSGPIAFLQGLLITVFGLQAT